MKYVADRNSSLPEAIASAAQVNYKEEELKLKLIGTLSLSECYPVIKDMSSHSQCRSTLMASLSHTHTYTRAWFFENK